MTQPDTPAEPPRFITTTEVAAFFRTSPETVRYWRHIDYGPKGRRVGRRVLYDRQEVEAFWDSLRTSASAERRAETRGERRAP